MGTTKNIKLNLPEGSDFVSRETLNTNFEKIDQALGIDYICERGRSGDWEYVKFASGYMEQWVVDKAFPTQVTYSWGSSLTRTPSMNFGNFPIAFKSIPLCFVTFNSAGMTGLQSLVGYAQALSTTKPPNFFLVDPAVVGTAISTPHFGVYARGYYK